MNIKLNLIFLSICLILQSIAHSQVDERRILPQATDPSITEFNLFHEVMIQSTGTKLNKLLVFYPGTGGPGFGYSDILTVGAELGYHAIGLTHQNPETINGLCSSSSDPECTLKAREEVFSGEDVSDVIEVSRTNSIENRLIKLLEYLDETYPEENWGQFLNNGQIEWSNLVLAGHSQGGGHAGYQAYTHSVERVFMIGSLDANGFGFAPWMMPGGETSKSKWYSFAHERDELIPFSLMQQAWSFMEIDEFGPEFEITESQFPEFSIQQTRTLFTNIEPADGGNYHGLIAAKNSTPRTNQGEAILAPAWKYALQLEAGSTSLTQEVDNSIFQITSTSIYSLQDCTISIFNSSGQEVLSKKLSSSNSVQYNRILSPGVYIILGRDESNSSQVSKLMIQ